MTEGSLPVVSGRHLIKFLQSLGYKIVRQRGSHIRLEKHAASGVHAITVPNHREIAKGTLSDILGALARNIGRDKSDLIKNLSDF